MSSRFVPEGATEGVPGKTDDWDQAKQDVEDTRRRKEEESRQAGGKSLYEILQQNKAAKQEAFEESIRLKNQFRSLDEDEVEFLDSVLESTRAKEAALKKETQEQLEIFRKQQEQADRAQLLENDDEKSPTAAAPEGSEEQWKLTGRKRRRVGEKEGLKGVKIRKSSSTSEKAAVDHAGALDKREQEQEMKQHAVKAKADKVDDSAVKEVKASGNQVAVSASASNQVPAKGLLSLDYGSDEDG